MLNLLLDLLLHLLLSTGLMARVTCSSRRTITLTGDGRNPSLQRLNTILIKPSHSIDLRVLLVVELPLILQEAPIVVVAQGKAGGGTRSRNLKFIHDFFPQFE